MSVDGSTRLQASSGFERLSAAVTRAAGTAWAFFLALACVAIWAVTGPLFHFSDNWQLVINTGTTIVTFLMVFLIQQAQNKDSVAIHLKLNELIASHRAASNRLIAIEDLDEEELRKVREFYCSLAALADKANGLKESHSLDEARAVHERKQHTTKPEPTGRTPVKSA